MDLLDFQAEQLYFDEPINPQASAAIDKAAELYGEQEAENLLLRAYYLEPEHPVVLVALYRYFYYQHRLQDAMRIAERVIGIFAKRLDLPEDWHELNAVHFANALAVSMTNMRFYMLALKGAAFLELRQGDTDNAFARLQKIADLDEKDRLGAKALMDIAKKGLYPRVVKHAAEG